MTLSKNKEVKPYLLDEKFTKEQRNFITANKRSTIILSACAGSGKTTVAVERMKYLINHEGVDPSQIIFFSFTVVAVEELRKRINNDKIKITTIHAFCMSLLNKMGKYKEISSFYDFITWYKEYNKPKKTASARDREKYYDEAEKLYEKAEYLSSSIAAFKLQTADGIKCKYPDYFKEYCKFLKDKKARDFSDMLIEVRDLLKINKWLSMFKGKHQYVFIDEYQDVSCCQISILLSLNANYYYLMGDRAQSIFSFSGTNCLAVEDMVRKRRKTVEMNLSTNFRSAKLLVEYSNQFSNLKAIASHQHDGSIKTNVIFFDNLVELFKVHEELVVLARTNDVIKQLEKKLLALKIPIRYFNYLTPTEIDELKKGIERLPTKRKVSYLLEIYGTADKLIEFIEENQNKNSKITSIHKSKGAEYDTCVIVNSISPQLIEENEIDLTEEQWKYLSFDLNDPDDIEAKCVHYVAASRAKNNNYFMIMDV